MNLAGLSELDLLSVIAGKVNAMQADIGALLQAQQVNNFSK